jgi:hypothetical protein
MKACQETTETDTENMQPDPRTMRSVAEYQEIPKEKAAVMPARGLRKRRRDQNLAARCCQKPKGRIQAVVNPRKDWLLPAEG